MAGDALCIVSPSFSMPYHKVNSLIDALLVHAGNASGAVRRATSKGAIAVVRHCLYERYFYERMIVKLFGLVSAADLLSAATPVSTPQKSGNGGGGGGGGGGGAPTAALDASEAQRAATLLKRHGHILQGVLYALIQLVRLSSHIGVVAAVGKHPIVPHLPRIAAMILFALYHENHNVVGLALELLQVR